MITTILVAVICNIVAALILLSGIFTSAKNSWKLALIKFCLTAGSGVGIYFATPALSNIITNVAVESTTIGAILANLGVSTLTVNSILFTVMFVFAYGLMAIIYNIVRHAMIKSFRNKSQNSAKMKRARSINPKAEKLAKRAEWRDLTTQYKSSNNWFKRLISILLGSITAIILGLIVLMPFGYVAEDLNKAGKVNLETGFDYTLNGVIDNNIDFKVFDWLVSAQEQEIEESEEPEAPSCEHSYIEGVCEHCGEAEVVEPEELE